jgi:hypothetical protein
MSEAVILLCPCCASTVDAHTDPEPQQLECATCGQTWTMIVDRERQAAHSLT